MLRVALRWLAVAILSGAACESPPEPSRTLLDAGLDYLASAATRRAILERTLVNHDNGYAKLRLERYTDEVWGALPEWNPRVRPATAADLGAGRPAVDGTWTALPIEATALTEEALLTLGADAFRRYPSQLEPALTLALEDAGAPARYGLWERDGSVGGIVWVDLPDGPQPAFTCSTCHGTLDGDALVLGLGNPDFDYGQLLDDYYGRVGQTDRWGAGNVDVTSDDLDNATRIADLRVARFQTHFNRAATLHADFEALAVRLETAIVVNSGQAVRPPRALVVALSLYLWSLGEPLPELGDGAGREAFDRECGGCHVPPGLSGPAVPLAEVGTDPTVGLSPMRTTGAYQTPSLRGVGQRRRLLADGAVLELDALLDPQRNTPGHAYGFGLDAAERDALLELLRNL